uniref:Down syndrome cell adhesion molecule-like protein Dscam2 n=1 Tax=Bursaphelenchus xylophilus TaxID=6326 RepID=A0A1I7RWJ2_BURXY
MAFEASEERQFLNNNQQLYIDSAQLDDAGVYTCIGENEAGKATKNIVITMLDAPVVVVPYQDVEARENETITLTCPVNDPSLYRMTWLKDDAVVTNSPTIQVSESGYTLHFSKVSARNAGEYICEVANDAGETKATLNLAVLTTPHIQQPAPAMRNVAIRLEERLSLNCNADGEPKPEISWLFDGQPIASGELLVEKTIANVENGHLVVQNVSTLHEGRYTCVAQNKAGRTEADVFVEVVVPPRLELPNEVVKVVQNKNLTIKARLLQGTEPLEVSWKKGGLELATVTEPMDGGVFYVIRLVEVKPSDGGQYTVTVQNKGGMVKEKIRVEVLTPPIITPGERVFKVVERTDLTLECLAEGSPSPKIKWYQNGKGLNRTHPKLELKDVTTENEGRYTCEALNDAGSVSTEFAVEVYVRPKILEYEKVIKAIDGSKVRLECKFTGNPEPTVKWMRSGRPITNAPNIILSPRGETLLIPKAKATDAGDYSCVVSNKAGQAEAPFSVLIQTAPHIDDAIDQNPTVVEGAQLTLECPVQGSPDPLVTWRFLDNDISPSATEAYVVEGTNLKVVNATVGQAGRYTCWARNEIGELETNYELEVIAAPRFGNAVNKSYTVIEGDSLDIVCPVEANPTPTIEWLRNGVDIDFSSSKFHVSPNAKKLKLTNATLSDAGKYVCRASNVAGSNDIDLSVRVIVPPRIDESNVIRNPLAVLGRSIYLECPATAIPQPMIMWLKDGRPVDYGEKISDGKTLKFSLQQGNQTFGIREVEHSDRGAYTCFVQNQGGSASEDFEVDVLIPPVMDKDVATTPQLITKRENESVVLTCPVKTSVLKNDVNDLSISWTQDGRPVDVTSKNVEISSNGKRLTIKSIKVADNGHYKCVASNRAGQSHAKFHVDVLSQPVIIEEKINAAPTVPIGRSTVLWCPASGHPPPTVKWFKGNGEQVKEVPGKIRLLERGQGLELIQAGLEDIGTWTCHAENDAGVTEKVITLNVYVEPKVEVRAQDNPVKPVGSSVTIFCNATGNPKPALSWNIDGKLLIPSANTAQVSLSGTRLDIMNLQADNTGSYECVARNELGSAHSAITVDILVTPEINRENLELNRRLITGRSVTLYCEAGGKPTPRIEWFLNGTLITEENATNIVFGTENKFIQISNATLADKGVYECRAENGAGKDSLQYVITVDLSPSIMNSGTNKVVEGNVAVMECVATGEPKPKITWQRNGIRVETGARYMVEESVLKIIDTHSSDSGIYVCVATNEAGTDQQAFTLEEITAFVTNKKGQLQLGDTELTDEGEYECTVTNSVGNATQKTQLYVGVPPKINEKPLKVVVKKGERAKVWCETVGIPPPEISWNRDNVTITKEHLATDEDDILRLAIVYNDVQPTDAGIYTCTAKNWAGTAEKDVDLVVLTPPVIEPHQLNVNASLGDTIILPCNASGNPEPVISWMKVPNMTLIGKEDKYKNLGTSLAIQGVSIDDDDFYQCIARSDAGTATGVRRVTVNNIHLTGPPRVWVECDKEGNPTANAYVPPRGDVPTDIDPTDIEYLPWEERHLYHDKNGSNVIYFKCFPTSRDPRHLGASPAPQPPQFIETPPRLIQIEKAQPLKLKCSATGMPAPVIVWSINGKIVDSSMDLLDLEAGEVEEGRYVCTARNDVGEEHAIAKVEFSDNRSEIRRAPKKEPLVPLTVIDCKNPSKDLSWYFDGERIEPMMVNDRMHILSNGSLILHYFIDKDEIKKYHCEVLINGKDHKFKPKEPATLEVAEVAPVVEIPQSGRIVGQTGKQVVLDCNLVKGTPLLTRIRWTKDNVNLEIDGSKFVFAKNNSLVINDLTEADRGSYKCRAWNKKGKSYDEVGLIVGSEFFFSFYGQKAFFYI